MNPVDIIIIPTGNTVVKFLESVSRMSIVDYDLSEVICVTLDALAIESEVEQRSLALINTYSDLSPGYDHDSIIMKNALQTLLFDMNQLIACHGLRDQYGYFHYVFEDWHNLKYDAVLRYRK